MARRPLFVFYGHHKGATGWISGILRETCFHLGWRFRVVHRPVDWADHGSLRAYVEHEDPDILAYTNAKLEYAQTLPPHRAFHVVRDPRDLLISAYFSHLRTHPTQHWPELVNHRARLQQVSKEEGLLLELDFSAPTFEELAAWDYHQPHVLEFKMEDVTSRPLASFSRIYSHAGFFDDRPRSAFDDAVDATLRRINTLSQRGRHRTPYGLPLLPFRFPLDRLTDRGLKAVLRRRSFRRLSGGRKKGEEDPTSHYRKGEPGDWKNHFSSPVAARFGSLYGDLLDRLGYSDTAWTSASIP